MRPELLAAGLFHTLIDHSKNGGSMLLKIRGRSAHSKITVIVVRLNIALCLFGIAAILKALIG